jgi:hypothetical protein
MKIIPKLSSAVIGCLLLTSIYSCKPVKKTTSCSSTLYGFKSHSVPYGSSVYYFDSNVTGSIINPTTAAGTGIGTFTTHPYAAQGTFNGSDNCYYALKTNGGKGAGSGTLYRTGLTGATVALTGPSTSIWAITYNKIDHKLYCIAGTQLAEIVVSGTSYTLSPLVTPLHPFFSSFGGDNTTVDDNTGAVYFTSGDTTSIYIEKYIPGASSTTVVAHVTGAWDLLGVRFNSSDNMLYGIKEIYPYSGSSHPHDFIKIEPVTGTETMIAHLGFDVNPEIYSAAIDPCSNRYLISTVQTPYAATIASNTFTLDQLDMSGTVVQHDMVSGMYFGLAINY